MSFEAYSVAVKLSLVNHVSSGLLMISGHLGKTSAEVSALESKLKSLGKMTLVGGALLGSGLMLAGMFKAPLDEAQKFQNEVQRFRALNLGDAVNKDAIKFATGLNTYGTSIRENLGLLRDAQTVFGDLHEAKMVTPLLAKMKFANAALYGDEGGAMKDRSFMDMLKVIEMRGGLASEQAFTNQANMVQRVQTATGGRVGANEFLNFIKTGSVAAKGLHDDIFYYKMEPLIQEMSGNRVGTGLMSGYQNLVQGRTTTRAANELMRLSLLDPKMVEWAKDGRVKQFKPGALKGANLMVSDPMKWMQDVLLPSFYAKGITSKNDVLNEIGAVFTNRTAAQLYSTMYLQQANIAKNYKLNKNAAGINDLQKLAEESYSGKKIELEKKWADLMLVVGNTVLPTAIKAVEWMTTAIKNLSTWAKDNQGAVQLLTYTFMGLSTVLMGAGLILMIRGVAGAFGLLFTVLRAGGGISGAVLSGMAMIGKLIMFGLRAIPIVGWVLMAISIGIYLYRNWDTVKAKAKEIWGFISPYIIGTWQSVSNMASSLWDGIKSGMKSFVGFFLDQWQYLFNGVIGKLNAFLPKAAEITPLHFADDWNKDGKKPAAAPVPTKNQQPIHVHTTLTLDGKKIASVVTKHQTNGVSKLPASTGVNPYLGMPFPSSF
jgi:hypothetical protein